MARTHFGTDGVRGIVGETLTLDLVEQLGRAATTWAGRGRVFVGRDTRGSGPCARGGGRRRGSSRQAGSPSLGGVLPTPAVALLAQDLGVVLSASHNPPEYNGVKLFDAEGHKLADADEEAIEALLDTPPSNGVGSVEPAQDAVAGLRRAHPGALRQSDLDGLRIAVDCANGAFSAIAPGVFERLGAQVTTVAAAPTATNINVGCGATDLALLQEVVRSGDYDLGVAFDGDGDRMLAVDETGAALDGDQILAVLALALGVDTVAVTTMTNLGFHRLMAERGHPRAHDRRRRPPRAGGDARRGRGARRRAVGSRDHRSTATSPATASPPRCCSAGRSTAARSRPRRCGAASCFRRRRRTSGSPVRGVSPARRARGRASSRPSSRDGAGSSSAPSGTEPLVRVLVEAEERGGGSSPLW